VAVGDADLYVIGEVAAMGLRHPDPGVAKYVACIVRDDPERQLPGERIILCCALVEQDEDGVPLVRRVLNLHTREACVTFLDRYGLGPRAC